MWTTVGVCSGGRRFRSGRAHSLGHGAGSRGEAFGIHRFRPGQRELIEAVLAGRDAIGVLPTGAGKSLCFQLLGGKTPRRAEAIKVLRELAALSKQGAKVTMRSLSQACDMSPRRISVLVNALEDIELIQRSGRALSVSGKPVPEQIEELVGDFEAQHAAERERLQAMVRYCEVLDCRMQFLREYFGEPRGRACEHCDNCREPVQVIEVAARAG